MSSKKRKVRTDFRKNREARARDKRIDDPRAAEESAADAPRQERVAMSSRVWRWLRAARTAAIGVSAPICAFIGFCRGQDTTRSPGDF